MLSMADENKLKPCLTGIIEAISRCIQDLKKSKSASKTTTASSQQLDDSEDDLTFTHGQLNPNINRFALDTDENDLLNHLTEDIEALLHECFSHLTAKCANGLADYLYPYEYDQEKHKFTRPLAKNILPLMRKDMKGLLGTLHQIFASKLDRYISHY